MSEETQMVLLEYRDYLRLKLNSDNYLKKRDDSSDCSCSKVKESKSTTKEGFGEIKVPEILPQNITDKATIYDGATVNELNREQGGSKSTLAIAKKEEKPLFQAEKEFKKPDWYFIGKPK